MVVDSVDIASLLGLGPTGTAWMGFTSATGKSVERHELLSWRMSDCSGLLATSVDEGSDGHGASGASRIVPMPSRDAARLFSTAMTEGKVTIVLYDVTGATLGTTVAGAGELAYGVDLPFRPSTGTYYIHLTDGMRSITLPWVVMR